MQYETLTLQGLIDQLRALPTDAVVAGMEPTVISYRGYYERNCIQPAVDLTYSAHLFADFLAGDIGKKLYGYKGGYFECKGDELVYLAHYGETGPNIIGLYQDDKNVYRPVTLTNHHW